MEKRQTLLCLLIGLSLVVIQINYPAVFKRALIPAILTVLLVMLLGLIFPTKPDPEKRRREALAAIGKRLKLQFNPFSDFELPEKYSPLSKLQRGDVRYAYNVFRGKHYNQPVTVFDYHFTIITGNNKGGGGGTDYYWSAFVMEMESYFPNTIISHKDWESRLAESLGKPSINFESMEFSNAFRVLSSDKKFAYDVCHPQMMEYLLSNPDLTVEISERMLALIFETWLQPSEIEKNLSRLVQIRKLMPNHLFIDVNANRPINPLGL